MPFLECFLRQPSKFNVAVVDLDQFRYVFRDGSDADLKHCRKQ